MPYTLSDFDYQLPSELIAQHPAAERSASRLLDARAPGLVDRTFRDLPSLVQPGDLMVFNDTQVVHARLFGRKTTGGEAELLIERVLESGPGEQPHQVAAHMRMSKKPPMGGQILLDRGAQPPAVATLLSRWPDANGTLFRFSLDTEPYALMAAHGRVPLPPYITHADDSTDAARYQTVLAKNPGAVAAPTAALHFDDAVLAALDARGVQRLCVTLHVGAGTFAPVKVDNIADHVMHSERYAVDSDVCNKIKDKWQEIREKRLVGQPAPCIWAVGTTTVRTLESWAALGMPVPSAEERVAGDTSIFITPGFEFQLIDRLITNFHLPKSTLMMLVSALAGHGHVMQTYAHAVAQRYRFFSYGDSMLLARSGNPPARLQL